MFTLTIVLFPLLVTLGNTLCTPIYPCTNPNDKRVNNTLLIVPTEHYPIVDVLSTQHMSHANLYGIQIINILKTKSVKPVHKYLFLLLIANAYDTETNPGPKTPRWPCGTCTKAVTWMQKAVCCDTCDTWYHTDCQGIPKHLYGIMNKSNISWHCIQCGMPNFSTSFFNTSTIETSNIYDSLNQTSFNSIGSPGAPTASSSPIAKQTNPSSKKPKLTTNKNKKILKILNLNFQSIKNKKQDLLEIIDTVKPDILIGTETWLDPSISSYEYFPSDLYNVFRHDRPPNINNQSHGGVLIAVTKDFISSEIQTLQTDCEIVWVEINVAGSRNIKIASFYRPPSDNGIALEQLQTSLNRLNNQSNSTVIIGGDFNLGHIDWSNTCVIPGKPDQHQHQMLIDITCDSNLHQVVNTPTRNDRILDLLFLNNPTNINKICTLPPIGLSDHDIVFAEVDIWLRRVRETPRKILKYKNANWENIKTDLDKIYSEIRSIYTSSDVNSIWEHFKTKLGKSVENNIPSKMLTYKHRLPWINNSLRKLINKKNRLYYKKRKDSNHTSQYKKLKAEVQKQQREAYWKYIETMICDLPVSEPDQPSLNQAKPKKLFQYIKSIRTDKSGIPALKKDGILTSDTIEKANILNEQFQSVFTSEPKDTIPDKGPSQHPNIPTLTISTPGIMKLLNDINPHKATGPDNINGHILKELKEQIAPILQLIFTKSFETGQTPLDWKHANVAPAFKKGDKHQAVNYRPISLTCISCKLMEHIITKHIMNHLENNKILYDLQHGFRHSRSCETQLLSFIQELSETDNKNIQTDLIIMDFAKAFDKVPHHRLLYKLKYYGISGQTLNWISAFLSNRTQTVVVDGRSSSTVPVTSGVPQGTVLGPVLFLVYINDLPDYLTYSKLRLFADDSILYRTIRSQSDCDKLQLDLDAAARWEGDWLMAFHPDKCTVLPVTKKKQPFQHEYILHNHILESVTSAKYLGVTVQSNLKWDKHINDITSKGNKTLGFLKRNLKTSNQQVKSQAYQALVRPKLEYSCSVWDPHTSESKSKIEMVQRRAARYVCNRYHNTSSVTDMLDTLNIPTLSQRRLRTRLVMMYKISYHLVAIPSDTLILADSRTRKNHQLTYRYIYSSKDSYRHSFFPFTIPQWNQLPASLVQAPSINSFRDQLTPAVLCTLI